MNSTQFVYWLQGFFEVGDPTFVSEWQLQEIRNHLELVLNPQRIYITC